MINRKDDEQDLSIEDWKKIIKEKFKKQHIFVVTLIEGETLLSPDIITTFCDEMPKKRLFCYKWYISITKF